MEPVTTPSIQIRNTTVKELDSVSLNCSSNDTEISIHWLFNGQSLELTDRMKLSLDNRTLSIDPVKREDSGKYQCEVSNPVSSERSDPIQLDIIVLVTTPSVQVSTTTVKELDSVSLTCSSNDTGISIHWLFNGQSLGLTNRTKLSLDNSTLIIDLVRREDAGEYQCEVSNPVSSERSDPIQLAILALLPKPSITSNNSNPMEGEDSVAFTCEPETENTSYLWRRNGQSLSEGDRLKLSEGNRTLTLLSVVRNDTGDYECETRNPVSTSRSDPFTLNITYGPDDPIISPSNTYFRSRRNLSLSCQAASNPPALYSWFVNGELLSSSQELFIQNITTNNSGSYTCFIYNSVTGLNKTIVKNIEVLEPVTKPSILVSNTTVKELDSVSLNCSSNDTGISIHWLFNGQSLELTDRMKLSLDNSILSIDPVKREDSGKYQCEVSNPVSSDRSDPILLDIIADPTQGSSGLSGGAIAGIVVGSVAGVTLIAALAYFLCF
ncbi:carcinoembryonic antigen-related cell adhesion molecule 1-like [Microtus ochrogaster]|uniref:Carcinoembryonic antigen-related cell adhesion molecule 1-like n=1 Tax=Microtus ochrogaster TaxID=79684 RepID=A0ABM0L8Q3_MICOH|nr:carcinoembryonic antigen-related cell adhesion molecule 1-like [Microtus ochrogaster]